MFNLGLTMMQSWYQASAAV